MPTNPNSSLSDLAQRIKSHAQSLGFDLCGIAPVDPISRADYFRQWLAAGKQGSMAYLANRVDERVDPIKYFPAAKRAICVAVNYHHPLEPPADQAAPARIARYALGDDYHDVIKKKLHQLSDWLRAQAGGESRCCVDTAPVMEKELAARAGIGWMGKNTCIIHPRIGSWILLGEVLTSLELPLDEPAVDRCGSCTRCIDACPTAAITAPYELDARKCISYLTIEHRADIDDALKPQIGDWIFGCDICQDVCPYNTKAPIGNDPAYLPRNNSGTLDAAEVLQWSAEQHQQFKRKSATARVKLPMLQRNARIVIENRDSLLRLGGK